MFITAICVLFPDLVRIRVIRHRCSVNPPRLCGIAVVWCSRICNPVDPTTWSTLSQPILDDESGFPNRSSASEAYSTKERRPQTPNEKYCEIIYDPILRFYLQIKSSIFFQVLISEQQQSRQTPVQSNSIFMRHHPALVSTREWWNLTCYTPFIGATHQSPSRNLCAPKSLIGSDNITLKGHASRNWSESWINDWTTRLNRSSLAIKNVFNELQVNPEIISYPEVDAKKHFQCRWLRFQTTFLQFNAIVIHIWSWKTDQYH